MSAHLRIRLRSLGATARQVLCIVLPVAAALPVVAAAQFGRFYLPPTTCEAMYDHTVNARSKGQWVNVAKAGGASAMK